MQLKQPVATRSLCRKAERRRAQPASNLSSGVTLQWETQHPTRAVPSITHTGPAAP